MIELLAIFSLALLGAVLGLSGGSEDDSAPADAGKAGTAQDAADHSEGAGKGDDGDEGGGDEGGGDEDGGDEDGGDDDVVAPDAAVSLLLRAEAAEAPGEPVHFDSFIAEGPEAELIAIVQPPGEDDPLVQPGHLHLLSDPAAPGGLALVFDNGAARVTAATIAGAAGKLTADHIVFVEEG